MFFSLVLGAAGDGRRNSSKEEAADVVGSVEVPRVVEEGPLAPVVGHHLRSLDLTRSLATMSVWLVLARSLLVHQTAV